MTRRLQVKKRSKGEPSKKMAKSGYSILGARFITQETTAPKQFAGRVRSKTTPTPARHRNGNRLRGRGTQTTQRGTGFPHFRSRCHHPFCPRSVLCDDTQTDFQHLPKGAQMCHRYQTAADVAAHHVTRVRLGAIYTVAHETHGLGVAIGRH